MADGVFRRPFRLPPQPSPLSTLSKAAGVYTLAAATGAFTLTGIAAGVRVQRKLTAAVGTFTETGIAVSFLSGHGFAAAVGTFTLTGNAVTFRAPYRLTAAVGAFVLTGNAATLSGPSSPGATIVLLGDGSGYPAAGHLTIGAEDIAYTGRTVAGGVTTFTGITRGARGTTIGPHGPGTLARNGEQIRRGQRVTLFLGYGPLDEDDYGPGPGYVKMAVEAVDSTPGGLGWSIRASDIQRFVKQSVFTGATSDAPVILGPDHPITLALKVLTSTGTPGVNGPYDTLPAGQGAAVPQTLVAIDLLEFLRDAVFPGLLMEFRPIDLEDAKQFVEGQCFRPLGLVPFITQRGRYSARPLRLPLFARSGFMVRNAFRAAA